MALVTGAFDTRREAEMSVERLVQQLGLDRKAIVIRSETSENSAGVEIAGADAKRAAPAPEPGAAALNGRILVSVHCPFEDKEAVREALQGLGAAQVAQSNA